MARRTRSIAFSAIAAFVAATPAFAQFGSIFTDRPPRPPADVPGGTSSQPPYYPGGRDMPPPQPLPAPMNLPPSNRPGAGGIQSESLPPPPDARVMPSAPQGQRPSQGASMVPPTALPPGPGSPRNAPQPANVAPQPNDEVVVEPPPQRIANPTAVFSGLDKITGRIISFDVAINETVQFGALQVTPRVCYSRPPTETPNTDAFVEVDEVTLQGEIKRIFTGWMFAASPGLHAVEHPIYDVWLTDCQGGQKPTVAEVPPEPPRQPARSQQQRRAPPPGQRAPAPGFPPPPGR
ncbi:MAG TPA: DUF2155 domain-containing protein [Pseudolabrys sp.]|nr:DUF2155 domain-containing protein [Pseudolabrys sp.]